MSFIKEWIYRLRHNRGFGIQSPAAFYFVMHILRECKHPYYCYKQIDKIAGTHSIAHYRRLFRISNHVGADNIITFADSSESALKALSLGNKKASQHKANNIEELRSHLNNIKAIGILYIGKSKDYSRVLQAALPHVDNKSVIIVEGIHQQSSIEQWWKSTISDPRIVVSMDIYSSGILFFDPVYKKQHYTFWFK